jgi:hypothetical protein
MAQTFRPCKWAFDDGVTFDGFTDGTYWNGFINIWITPEVRDVLVKQALEWDDEDPLAADLAEQQPDANGLISLAYGYATSEVFE